MRAQTNILQLAYILAKTIKYASIIDFLPKNLHI